MRRMNVTLSCVVSTLLVLYDIQVLDVSLFVRTSWDLDGTANEAFLGRALERRASVLACDTLFRSCGYDKLLQVNYLIAILV